MLSIEFAEAFHQAKWNYHNDRANLYWTKIEEVGRQKIKPVILPNQLERLMGRPEKIDFAALKAKIDLVEYISRYTELRQAGRTLKAKCPLPNHQDDSPSFVIYPESQSWWCFGCQEGSDIFDFAKKMEGITPSELASR